MSSNGATSRPFRSPEERSHARHTHLEVIDLGEFKVKRTTDEPERRVSTDTGPPPRSAAHVGYVVSGHVHVALEGGEELDVRAGHIFVIPPGHGDRVTNEKPRILVQPGEGTTAAASFDSESRTERAA